MKSGGRNEAERDVEDHQHVTSYLIHLILRQKIFVKCWRSGAGKGMARLRVSAEGVEAIRRMAKWRRLNAEAYSQTFFGRSVSELRASQAERLLAILVLTPNGMRAERFEIVERSSGFSIQRIKQPERASAHGKSFGARVALGSVARLAIRILAL